MNNYINKIIKNFDNNYLRIIDLYLDIINSKIITNKNYKEFTRMLLNHDNYYFDIDSKDSPKKCDYYNTLTLFLNNQERKLSSKLNGKYKYYPPSPIKKSQDGIILHESKITVTENGNKIFLLTSDQFGFSAGPANIFSLNKYNKYPLSKIITLNKNYSQNLIKYIKSTRDIGGTFVWPTNSLKYATCSYNTNRGINSYIEDRVDLTLEEVWNYYHQIDCKNNIMTNQVKKWLKHFNDFKTYSEFFCFDGNFVDSKGEYPKSILNSKPLKDNNKTSDEVRKNKTKVLMKLSYKELKNMLDFVETNCIKRTKKIMDKI